MSIKEDTFPIKFWNNFIDIILAECLKSIGRFILELIPTELMNNLIGKLDELFLYKDKIKLFHSFILIKLF